MSWAWDPVEATLAAAAEATSCDVHRRCVYALVIEQREEVAGVRLSTKHR